MTDSPSGTLPNGADAANAVQKSSTAKTLKRRVFDSFPEGASEDAEQYLEWLRSTLSDISANLRRTVIVLITLMAVFEIIIDTSRATFTLAGFSISKGSITLQFIPALISYLYLQVNTDSTRISYLHRTLGFTMARWSALAEENDLDVLIRPYYPLYYRPHWTSGSVGRYRGDKATSIASGVLGMMVQIIPLAFTVQAYWVLFQGHSVSHYVIWSLSLTITLFCLVTSSIHVSEMGRAYRLNEVLYDGSQFTRGCRPGPRGRMGCRPRCFNPSLPTRHAAGSSQHQRGRTRTLWLVRA